MPTTERGRSWDAAVRALTSEEVSLAIHKANAQRVAPMPPTWARGEADWDKYREREALFEDRCRVSGPCMELATHEISYRYVTGRRGRVSVAEKRACVEHARRFAAKHDIEIPGYAA